VQFIDLGVQQSRIRDHIDSRISAVLDHGKYIMGPEVAELETALSDFCGAKYCVTCANGTDALHLAMLALGIGPGDAVLVPSFTFAATAEAPCLVGATPVFVDIDPSTYNMDPFSLSRAIEHTRTSNLTPKAVIAVDLFGLPANYPAIEDIVQAEGLKLICDSAQGWGGEINGRKTGTYGDLTTTSFFPAKPLGCYGDGGAIFTDDPDLAFLLDSLRVHGKGTEKYDNVRVGMNSRLDTIQAAVLLEKLTIYADEIEARNRVASRYSAAFEDRLSILVVPEGYRSIWAQYTARARDENERQRIMAVLKEAGVPSVVYYPRPLHLQTAYRSFPTDPAGLMHSETAASSVFSLPMHPYLEEEPQQQVISAVLRTN
jgi:UDP-2-acetamido-2-deoxy-ribo-hexuluronate aminotransferase